MLLHLLLLIFVCYKLQNTVVYVMDFGMDYYGRGCFFIQERYGSLFEGIECCVTIKDKARQCRRGSRKRESQSLVQEEERELIHEEKKK